MVFAGDKITVLSCAWGWKSVEEMINVMDEAWCLHMVVWSCNFLLFYPLKDKPSHPPKGSAEIRNLKRGAARS
jgi:hypothetical protein